MLVYDPEVQLSSLLGANRRYIEQHVPHLGQLIRNDIESVIENRVAGSGPQRRAGCCGAQGHVRPDQTVLDLVKVAGEQVARTLYRLVLVIMSGLIANVVALIAGTGWLAKLTLPFSQAVRVRNAFLLRRGLPEDFNWTPSSIPSGFRVEHGRAPSVIDQAVRDNGLQNADQDWVRALGLVTMLVRHGRNEGAIRADLVTTYNGIVAGKGYCSDYVRVYLAAAISADLFCRQWAFSFDGFGGHGHTFVEVYDRQRARWIFVDVHNNVYAVLSGTDEPIDALTLRQALVTSPASIEFRRAGPGRLGFEHFHKLLDYYRRGASQWYLWWGNASSRAIPPDLHVCFPRYPARCPRRGLSAVQGPSSI